MNSNFRVGDTVQDIHTKDVGTVTAVEQVKTHPNITSRYGIYMKDFHYTVRFGDGVKRYYLGCYGLVLYKTNDEQHNKEG